MIQEREAKEGLEIRMDRRSLKRLLARLANEGKLTQKRIILKIEGGMEKTINFICRPGVDNHTNSVIRSAIEQAKIKLFCISRNKLHHLADKHERVKSRKLDFGKQTSKVLDDIEQSIQEVRTQLAPKK